MSDWMKWGRLHDAVFEALDVELTLEDCEKVFELLPQNVKGTALSWGFSDTVFGDEVFRFAKENKEDIMYIVAK